MSDTYLHFSVEEEQYELTHIVFNVTKLNHDNFSFIDLGLDPIKSNIVTAVPAAAFQWRMHVKNAIELQGRSFNLSDINDYEMKVVVKFTLSEDISLIQDIDSEIKLSMTLFAKILLKEILKGQASFMFR